MLSVRRQVQLLGELSGREEIANWRRGWGTNSSSQALQFRLCRRLPLPPSSLSPVHVISLLVATIHVYTACTCRCPCPRIPLCTHIVFLRSLRATDFERKETGFYKKRVSLVSIARLGEPEMSCFLTNAEVLFIKKLTCSAGDFGVVTAIHMPE